MQSAIFEKKVTDRGFFNYYIISKYWLIKFYRDFLNMMLYDYESVVAELKKFTPRVNKEAIIHSM